MRPFPIHEMMDHNATTSLSANATSSLSLLFDFDGLEYQNLGTLWHALPPFQIAPLWEKMLCLDLPTATTNLEETQPSFNVSFLRQGKKNKNSSTNERLCDLSAECYGETLGYFLQHIQVSHVRDSLSKALAMITF